MHILNDFKAQTEWHELNSVYNLSSTYNPLQNMKLCFPIQILSFYKDSIPALDLIYLLSSMEQWRD